MIILGVNGWSSRSHDSSAALIVDGEIKAFVEEERITRFKHAFGQLPHRAIQECLAIADVAATDIDELAIGWDYHKKYSQRGLPLPAESKDLAEVYLPHQVFERNPNMRISAIEHHRAHAASVVRANAIGSRTAAVLVVDGQGEDVSTSLWTYRGGALEKIQDWPVANSLGYYYEAHNRILGFDFLDSGKTMGLASYGKTILTPNPFKLDEQGFSAPFTVALATDTTDEQQAVVNAWFPQLLAAYGLDPTTGVWDLWATRKTEFTQHQKNIAYTIQQHVQEVLLHLAHYAKDKTGADVLCIAGGVGLNCPSNTAVAMSGLFDEVFVTPFASDQGVSLGAALEAADAHDAPFSPYTGREFSDDDIQATITKYALKASRQTDIASHVAQKVHDEQIVGWFQGKAEQGPRALGNRSILANPTVIGMNDRVNKLKSRELWRPLAPSMLDTEAHRIFEEPLDSPHMLQAFHVRTEFRQALPAVVHTDGSARPQTVTETDNPRYFALLTALKNLTGYGVVLNTSFNGPAEPIVYTPEEAVRMFLNTDLDGLALGNWYITKR